MVDFAYNKGASSSNPFITSYSAADILSIWGSYLAFLGTVTLGIIAVWQNYRLERITMEQRHQSVRPLLSISEFDLIDSSEIDFYLGNEGIGMAFNIELEVIWLHDSQVIFTDYCHRLQRTSDYNSALYSIVEELNEIRNMGEMKYTRITPTEDIFYEIPIKLDIQSSPVFAVKLVYEDIYGKKYISTFDIIYDIRKDEVASFKENHKEFDK